MGRWVYAAFVVGVVAACSSESSPSAKDGAGQAGDAGESSAGESAAHAGSSTLEGGQPGAEAGGTATNTPNAGQPASGGVGQATGGEAGAEAVAGAGGIAAELPIFEVLDVPTDATGMTASAISADGLVVVGNVTLPTHTSGFRWTRKTGVVLLDTLAGDDRSSTAQVDANGDVVVGGASLSPAPLEAVAWSAGTKAPHALITNAWKSLTATHVNADGTVIAGSGTLANDTHSAYRWIKATGPVAIGVASATDLASVVAISADGLTIVGNSGTSNAFVWTKAGGSKKLPTLEGDTGAVVQGMSADGTTMIGDSVSGAPSSKRVRWVGGAAPVLLDPLDPGTAWGCGGGPLQTCTTVYTDGSVIYTQRANVPVRYTATGLETFVGYAGKFACLVQGPTTGPVGKVAGTCFGPPLAVMWNAKGTTVRKLADVLTDAGADASLLANANISIIRGVSANGDTIVGDNFTTELWIARPPQ